jgi:hypothetical protein
MHVEMTIDRLILHNVTLTAADRAVLKRVVEEELARLITQGAADHTLDSAGALRAVQTQPIILPANGDPAGLGKQIAGAIWGGLQTRRNTRAPGQQMKSVP